MGMYTIKYDFSSANLTYVNLILSPDKEPGSEEGSHFFPSYIHVTDTSSAHCLFHVAIFKTDLRTSLPTWQHSLEK
jgi:hypothetical protein